MVETKWIKFGAVGTAIVATAGVGIGLAVSQNKSSTNQVAGETLDHFEDVGKEATTPDFRYVDPSPKVAETFGSKLSESYLLDSNEMDEDPCATGGGERRNLRNGRKLSVVSKIYRLILNAAVYDRGHNALKYLCIDPILTYFNPLQWYFFCLFLETALQ